MSIFKQIFLSCTSFDFYISIYKNSYKKTLRFLLAFLLLAGLVTSVMRFITITEKLNLLEKWALETSPVLENAELILKKQIPFKTQYNNFTFIINTQDDLKIIPDKYVAGLMLTKTHMLLKNYESNAKKPYDKEGKSIIFDKETIAAYKASILSLILFIMVPGGIIIFILMQLVSVLFFAAITIIYTGFFNRTKELFNFTQSFNICSYAIIPPSSFMLLFFNSQNTTAVNIIYFAMYAAFTGGAVTAIKKTLTPKED